MPAVHDEFSYLLGADTFASGRPTNPAHPHWRHLETFHVLQQPTYSSKYPPGQGFLLAGGWKLFGIPASGAWVGAGIAAAAICWMMRAWVSPRWCILGGVIAATHREILGWSQTYEGAHVAVIGAALLVGASKRMSARRPARDACLMAAGCALLCVSRPFEGLVLAAACGIWLLARARVNPGMRQALRSPRGWFAAATILMPAAGIMAWHNARVTGSPIRLPYGAYQETYGHSPIFLWQEIRPPKSYRHDVMRRFYLGWESEAYREQRQLSGFAASILPKLLRFLRSVFGGWIFLLPLLIPAGWVRSSQLSVGMMAVIFCALLAVPWMLPQYAAAAIPLGCMTVILWARATTSVLNRFRFPSAPCLVLIVATGCLLNVCGAVIAAGSNRPSWAMARVTLERSLARAGGKHLIFVRYGPGHSPHEEWVYNRADIDRAPIVWARELGPQEDARMVKAMLGRRPWLLMPDEDGGPRLVAWPNQDGSPPNGRGHPSPVE